MYLFILYRSTLSAAAIILRQMVGYMKKDELERLWTEVNSNPFLGTIPAVT
jgi:hypothetical protein